MQVQKYLEIIDFLTLILFNFNTSMFDTLLGLRDITRLILILYGLASIFKTIIDTQYVYTVFDIISRL